MPEIRPFAITRPNMPNFGPPAAGRRRRRQRQHPAAAVTQLHGKQDEQYVTWISPSASSDDAGRMLIY